MKQIEHLLPPTSIGTRKSLVSIHFGESGSGRKVYIQAGPDRLGRSQYLRISAAPRLSLR